MAKKVEKVIEEVENELVKITNEELNNIQKELSVLYEQLKIATQAVQTAREHGDLSENSEYHAAKEEQSRINNTIADIEYTIANHTIVEPKNIKILDLSNNKEYSYTIVGSIGSDPLHGKISSDCPLAKAIKNASVGDEVLVKGPKPYKVKILKNSK